MALESLSTIGYESASVEKFLATLTAAGVNSLLDVREFAGSRRKGFAKTALRSHLAGMGIAYRHEPSLGSPRDIRHRLRADRRYDVFFAEFERHLATQLPLLQQLSNELSGHLVLMCYERNHTDCHRSSVAAALGKISGLSTTHRSVQS